MFATRVDISVGWRFDAQLLRPMHGRLLELDRLRWQKRDLRLFIKLSLILRKAIRRGFHVAELAPWWWGVMQMFVKWPSPTNTTWAVCPPRL